MIQVTKLDEVYLVIKADMLQSSFKDDIKQLDRISTFFSAYAEGSQHTYEYKSGKWDGMTRFLRYIEYGNYIFPIGLLNKLVDYCDINNIDLNIQFDVEDIYTKKEIDWKKFNTQLNFPDYFEKRDYQIQYVDEIFRTGRGCIISPTGSGKSAIIHMIIQNLILNEFKNNEKIILIVPTVDLIRQMYDEFIEYGFENIDDYVYMLSAGIPKVFEKQITISTWQSLQNLPPETFEIFSCLIVDECHGVSSTAEKLSYISHNCVNAKYRIGTTGTTPEKNLDEMTMVSYLGPLIKKTSTTDLIRKGYLSTLSIKTTILHWKRKGGFDIGNFQEEYKEIVENEERRNIILEMCKQLLNKNKNQTILVLGRRTEYLKQLKDDLENIIGSDGIKLVTGKHVKKKDRLNIYNEVRESGGIIFATEKLAGTGLNIKNIENVILATPLKSKVTVLQAIGRGVRKVNKSINHLNVFDFVDRIPIANGNGRVNSSYKWVNNKENIYINECFTNKFYILNLPIK